MRRCAWSLAGLLIAVCVGAAAAGSTVTSAHPAGRRRLTYEYAPTADATPYCRLQNPSVCWGNTHRFLEVTANGPFDGIDLRFSDPKSALADLDGDGTLRPRPSIDKLRSHVLCLSQATWTSWWEMRLARSPTLRTRGRLRRRCSCNGPEARTPSTALKLVGTAPPTLGDFDNDGTRRPCPSIDKLRPHVFCPSQATWTSSRAVQLAIF